jgi:SAM-dependent methyltransferase
MDAGSGLSNRLLDWYRPRVRHAYLVEFLAEPRVEGNTTILRADLEKGIPMDDESVDLVTSCSSIEHLSADGQSRFMSEAERILCPGGLVIMTVSHVFGMDAHALKLLSTDPAMVRTGCTISARLNLRSMLEAAARLHCPEEPKWTLFPGFDGFTESTVLNTPGIIFDRMASYGDVRCLPETDALGLRWAEIGIYLVKRGAAVPHSLSTR